MNIFDKQARVNPSAMAQVAEQRYADAQALCDTGRNPRANGVAYLGGLVIEILLKGLLSKKYPDIARKQMKDLKKGEVQIWSLIWRSHDLESILAKLDFVEAALLKQKKMDGGNYYNELKILCETWTIHARYSTKQIEADRNGASPKLFGSRKIGEGAFEMTQQQVLTLKKALKKQFSGKIEAEQVAKGRFRFALVSPKFEKMHQLDRQDAIWEIVDQTLPPKAILDISLILAFAPKDLVA